MEHSHNIGLDPAMFQVIKDNASSVMCAAKKEIPPIEQQMKSYSSVRLISYKCKTWDSQF